MPSLQVQSPDEKIIQKAFKKHIIPFGWIIDSWNTGQQKNPHINEGRYHAWRNDDSMTPKQKIGMAMRETRDNLTELERVVKYNVKLKNEIYTRYQRHEAIVDENYSYTEFVNLNPDDKIPDGEPGMADMLFDMKNDKDQNIDISNRPSSQKLVKKYKDKLALMRKYVNEKKIYK